MPENSAVERAFIWVGFAGMLLCFVGLAVADLLPPPSPDQTAEQVAAFYQHNTNAFRIGLVLLGFGGAFVTPWIAVVARRMHRIPGHGPLTSYCFLGVGLIVMFQIVLPVALGQVVAFRPERAVEDTKALSDLFFILLISPSYLYIVQLTVMAVAILADPSPVPVFPRWTGYVCLWVAAGSVFSILVIFFKAGPFAWNGLFGWWIPAGVFGLWVASISWCLLKPPGARAIAPEPAPAAAAV
jgi:hypothetical protein